MQVLNPLPMVAMMANCTAWLVYACFTTDRYVLVPNEVGVLLGCFMSLSCHALADEKVGRGGAALQHAACHAGDFHYCDDTHTINRNIMLEAVIIPLFCLVL